MPSIFLMLQFSWRLLVFLGMLVSLYAPLCITYLDSTKISKQVEYILYLLIIIILIYSGFNSINYYSNFKYSESLVIQNVLALGFQKEYLPYNPKKDLYSYNYNRDEKIYSSNKKVKIKITENNFPSMKFKVSNLDKKIKIELPRTYYLGYHLRDNKGREISLYCGNNGLLKAKIKRNGSYTLVHTSTLVDKIENGSITIDGNTILENINFCVKDNEKIGIIGRNGSGKSTLLKAIIGKLELNDGYDKVRVDKTNDFKIGYASQNIDSSLNIKMIDYIKSAYSNLVNIEKNLRKLEKNMEENYQESDLLKYNDLLLKYSYLGGYKYIGEYENALSKFGFRSEDKNKYLKEFSGGQLTKLSLIKILLSKPDLLILDEPTNHLDMTSIEWLENYLNNYKKSIIIVSHDRMLLDNVCNIIYNIEYGVLKRYSGNYSYFLKQYNEEYIKAKKDYNEQQKEIKRLQSIVDRFKYKPTKARMALSKLKQIERMNIIEEPKKVSDRTFKINFDPNINSYKDILKLKNLAVGYDKKLCTLNFNLERGDKLGVIGKNGTGKSTLIKTILGTIPPLSGKCILGDRLEIGYFSQQLDNLEWTNTIYDEIDKTLPELKPNEIRNLLGTFGFSGDDVFKKINDLSGGEKVRVSLCKILSKKPNLLIMDEPTNHLDIVSKDTIEKLLKNYKGSVIVVSHDRYLIKNVCNKVLALENEIGTIYNGYLDYLEKRNPQTNQTPNLNSSIKKEKNLKKVVKKDKSVIIKLKS